MKVSIELPKWHLPLIGTILFWNQHQGGSSVILGSIANISSEIEIEARVRSMRHFMEHSLKCVGVSKNITIDELEGGVPPIFRAFQIQRGTQNKTKETKKIFLITSLGL